MANSKTSYKQIVKATSLFGGVQVFQIIIRIIRSKFVAVLLGPNGVGIVGLFNSTIDLVSSITNFGLKVSAVKDIAEANSSEKPDEIASTALTVRRLVWFTGLLGGVLTFAFSQLLSNITFGTPDYSAAFKWLSITLLFNQLSIGQMVLLQGMRKLQYLAKSSLFGSFLGLILVIPIYYFYGVDGIVPGIIITSLIALSLTWYYSNKIEINKVTLTFKETVSRGEDMMILGFMIGLSGLLSLATAFLLRIFISNTGSVDQVGLFTAGFAIINTYVGMVFNAMGTDFYPRLSSIASNLELARKTIVQQAEIAILILAPFLMILLVFIKLIIIILYSTKFIDIHVMVYWAILGVFFKAVSWSISYIFLAKSASRIFFLNELAANLYTLGLNVVGYYFMGLEGLGISFLISYALYFIQVYIVAHKKYNFHFDTELISIFAIQFSIAVLCFLCVVFLRDTYAYIFGIIAVAISALYSFKELDKRLEIKKILNKFLNNR